MQFKLSVVGLLASLSMVAADTLTVTVFTDVSCTANPQTFTIGNLNECHATLNAYNSVKFSNIATSFFGRNLRYIAWRNDDCTGDFSQIELSNNGACHANEGASFDVQTLIS